MTKPHEPTPFWQHARPSSEMTPREWESLCDGCGRCCLNKLSDEDTGQIVFTDVGCRLLDEQTCRCTDYAHRQARVKDCVRLTPRNVRRLAWLPPTCGYRLVAEGRDLYWWHPLVSGDPETVHDGRRLGARPRCGEREGRAGRQARGVHRQLAGEGAEGRPAQAGARFVKKAGEADEVNFLPFTSSPPPQSENHKPAPGARRNRSATIRGNNC